MELGIVNNVFYFNFCITIVGFNENYSAIFSCESVSLGMQCLCKNGCVRAGGLFQFAEDYEKASFNRR